MSWRAEYPSPKCFNAMMRVTTYNYPRRNCDFIDPLIKYPYADSSWPRGGLSKSIREGFITMILVSFRDIDIVDTAVCWPIHVIWITSSMRYYPKLINFKLWSITMLWKCIPLYISKSYSIKRIIYCYVAFVISICKY